MCVCLYCYRCWRCEFWHRRQCYKMKLTSWICWNNCHISWGEKKVVCFFTFNNLYIIKFFNILAASAPFFCSLLMLVSLPWRGRIKHTLRSRLEGGEFFSNTSVLRNEQWSGRVFLNLLKRALCAREWVSTNTKMQQWKWE